MQSGVLCLLTMIAIVIKKEQTTKCQAAVFSKQGSRGQPESLSLYLLHHNPSLNSPQATTGQLCVNFKANHGSLTLTEMRFRGKKSCWRRGLEPGGRALSGISEPFSPGSGAWHGSQRCQMAEARGCGPRPQSPQFSQSIVSDSLQPHGLQHARPPGQSPTPGAGSNSCPLS